MTALRLDPNIADVDHVYQQLIDLHAGRSDEDSQRINARLILILMNHIGDMHVLRQAMACAAEA